MRWWESLLACFGVLIALYAVFVLWLVAAGRRADARALAGFIPDCVVLFRRLLGDERVPRSRKLVVVLLIAYLALPIDLVPDFIPVAGQLDDTIVVVIVLRLLVRSGGPELIREHWRGPASTLDLLLRLAYGRPSTVPLD